MSPIPRLESLKAGSSWSDHGRKETQDSAHQDHRSAHGHTLVGRGMDGKGRVSDLRNPQGADHILSIGWRSSRRTSRGIRL